MEIEILEKAWAEHEWMLEGTAFNTRCVPRFGVLQIQGNERVWVSRVQNIRIISEENCKKLQPQLVSLEKKWEIEQKELTDPNSVAARRFKYLVCHSHFSFLSRHEIKEIKEKESGLKDIREGLNGEKWGGIVSFFARMLEVDPDRRANASELLNDEFIKKFDSLTQ